MFSFAMTSGLASDSDKFKSIITHKKLKIRDPIKKFFIFYNPLVPEFKIIITLSWAQKIGDTRPYKNFDFFL